MFHRVYLGEQDFDLQLLSIPQRPQEAGVLMIEPDHYDVVYEINPHMKGMIGCVDRPKAQQHCIALDAFIRVETERAAAIAIPK